MLKIGDKVKDGTKTFDNWIGEVKKLNGNLALVKYDPSYKQSEGLWQYIYILVKQPDDSVVGKQ